MVFLLSQVAENLPGVQEAGGTQAMEQVQWQWEVNEQALNRGQEVVV